MKQLFEQYGGVALGILALLVLIAMITPVGNIIKTSLQGAVQTFSTKMDGQVDTMTESMNAAFTNATDFTGIQDNLFYLNGSVPDLIKNMKVSANKTQVITQNGVPLKLIFDPNIIENGNTFHGSYSGLRLALYMDGEKIIESNNANGFAIPLVGKDHVFRIEMLSKSSNITDVKFKEEMTLRELFDYTFNEAVPYEGGYNDYINNCEYYGSLFLTFPIYITTN